MVVRRRRKYRKKHRGSRTCGWGRVQQHRKSGARGGKGHIGYHKHKWTWTVKYAPDMFGKHGFRPPFKKEYVAINLRDLDILVNELAKRNEIPEENGKYVVDLSKYGFAKLLGSGRITKPVVVKVQYSTEKAKEKVEAAGGQVVQIGG